MPIKQTLHIQNEKGLHARASAKFVEMVEKYDANAVVSRDGMDVAGNSIMGLMMLGAAKGTTIDVETSGEQEVELAEALRGLVDGLFDEGS
jgi:phosphocarrier protein HPr